MRPHLAGVYRIRQYVEARGGFPALTENEKAALAKMAKRRQTPKPHRPEDAKRSGVNLQPTADI